MRALRLIPALALPALAAAQETTGGVRGRLHSAVMGPVANAQITATSPDLLGDRRVLSAVDGVFQFVLLPPGDYMLRVTAIGHRPLVIQDVYVRLGRITGLGDMALEPAVVELGEITITAPSVTLDPVRTTVGATLTADDYAMLPVERDYRSAIAILPHVNTSYYGDPVNVGGSTGLENMYFIDGMNVTSPLNATRGTTLPYNFVRAVEVKAGGYEAQYGKALGAVVNAITYSGTNELEGQVFGFFTHDALAADPKALPALRETGAVSYDVGALVSGPLVRDRLRFSAAYNPRVDRVDKELPGLGVYTDETVAHAFAGKLTWLAAPGTDVELSLFGDPTTRHQVSPIPEAPSLVALNPDPFLRRLESGSLTGSLRATAAPGANIVLEAAVAYSRGAESDLAETQLGSTDQVYRDYVASTASGGVGQTREVSQGRATGLFRTTVIVGRHTVVGGIEYEDARITQTTSQSGGTAIDRIDAATWKSSVGTLTGTFHNRAPTAYVQDSWRTSDHLSVNVGVRWSSQTLTGASGGTAQRFPSEWQPRLGVSWQLGRPGTQRLFASYGRFYQQIPLNVATLLYVDNISILSYYSTDPRQPGATPDSVRDITTYEADWAKSIDGLSVENFDEVTLGYEHLLGGAGRLTVRGIRRDLRSSFLMGFDPALPQFWVLGTPGKGAFAFLPPPRREYAGLEFALDGMWRGLQYRASYVLSRNWGNYTGLYQSEDGVASPGVTNYFAAPWQASNSTGLLPNDRTHVLKLTAAYRPVPAFAFATFLSIASGTPRNDFGAGPYGVPPIGPPTFVAERGSIGRTPTLWDLNVRLAYLLPMRPAGRSRVVLDLLHLGNPRQVTQVDEQHYFALDQNGQQSNANANYLTPTGYQPPMAVRIGVELGL